MSTKYNWSVHWFVHSTINKEAPVKPMLYLLRVGAMNSYVSEDKEKSLHHRFNRRRY